VNSTQPPSAPFSARSALRLAGLAAWSAGGALLVAGGWLVTGWSARGRSAWRRRLTHWWARGSARILGLRVETRGRPPAEPALLVANHLGYLDVVLLASCLPTVFVAKRDVRRWPVIGGLAALAGTIFVDRDTPRDALRASRSIEAALARGDTVVLFAEGTSTRGERVLPLKPALLEPAARAGWAVRYAALSYRTPPGQPGADEAVCWWGDMEFLPHLLAVTRLPAFTGTVAFGADPMRSGDRRELAARLRAAIERDFTPVASGIESCPD
jgi:1-acyl-sn-glycerol-3-phosphate acyltransferase